MMLYTNDERVSCMCSILWAKEKHKLLWNYLTRRMFLTSSTPIFRHASRKLSTLRLHRAIVSLGYKKKLNQSIDTWNISQNGEKILTTAGEGTCILATDRGLTWFARWQRTTPSVNAGARSSGNAIFNLVSMCYYKYILDYIIKSLFASNSSYFSL